MVRKAVTTGLKSFLLSLRINPYIDYFGRRIFYHLPFLFPHDKSYFGLRRLIEGKQGLFLDIGAHDGMSVLSFRCFSQGYDILSFEPNPAFESALKKLKRRIKGVDYKMVGLSSEERVADLYIPYYGSLALAPMASVDPCNLRKTVEMLYPGKGGNKIGYKKELIKIKKLDAFGLKPDIIKIDTEGHEYNVLMGGKETITSCRPYLLVEYSPGAMVQIGDYFKSLDYGLFSYDHGTDSFSEFDNDKAYMKFYLTKHPDNIFCVPYEKRERLA